MKIIAVLLLIAIAFSVSLAGETETEEKLDEHVLHEMCKKSLHNIIKVHMIATSKCIKELHLVGRAKTEKFDCVVKCVIINYGVFSKDGVIDIDTAVQFVMEFVPIEILERSIKRAMKCFKFIPELDFVDASCHTWAPLIKCAMEYGLTLCDEFTHPNSTSHSSHSKGGLGFGSPLG